MYTKTIALQEQKDKKAFLEVDAMCSRFFMAPPLSSSPVHPPANQINPGSVRRLFNRLLGIPHFGIKEAENIVRAYRHVTSEHRTELQQTIQGILRFLASSRITYDHAALQHIRKELPLQWLTLYYMKRDTRTVTLINEKEEIYNVVVRDPDKVKITIHSDNFLNDNRTLHPLARLFIAQSIPGKLSPSLLRLYGVNNVIIEDDYDSWHEYLGYIGHADCRRASVPLLKFAPPTIKVSVNWLIYKESLLDYLTANSR